MFICSEKWFVFLECYVIWASYAPATFERPIERVWSGLHWETLLVYLDDVIVFGLTVTETISRLETVLQRVRAAGLKASKCHVFQRELHSFIFRDVKELANMECADNVHVRSIQDYRNGV